MQLILLRYGSGGIVPSNKTQYMLNDLESIVESQTGAIPYFGCVNNGTVLSEVWYFNHVFGTVSDTLDRHCHASLTSNPGTVW